MPTLCEDEQAPRDRYSAHRLDLAPGAVGVGHRRTTAHRPGRLRFTVVAMEYFTKWVEAEPLTAIRALNTVKFFWKNLICRFGIPHEHTIDNEK